MNSAGRIAVVGATGTIGSTLISALVAAGAPVRALVHDPSRAGHLPAEVEVVPADLTRPALLADAFTGTTRAFIVTNNPGLEPVAFEAAATAGVELIVKSSAVGPGGAAPTGHSEAESHLRATGVPWIVLRPNAFMQTFAQYLPTVIDASGTFRLPAADATTAWVDTRDIAAVAAAILTDPKPTVDAIHVVTGPTAMSMNDVAADLSNLLDRPIRYEPIPPDEADGALVAAGVPAAFAGFLAHHYAAVRAGDFNSVTDVVPRLLGRPATSWRSFLAEHPITIQGDNR